MSHFEESEEGPENLAKLLVAYDETLRVGFPATEGEADVPDDGDSRLTDAQECLHLLEQIWPRGNQRSVVRGAGQGGLPGLLTPNGITQIGRFEIKRVLGSGGFGVVYLAFDPLLQRPVALKVPQMHILAVPHLLERFHREAQAAAGLDHPHIVPLYETGTADGIEYLISAYCPGPNLAEWLNSQTEAIPPRLAAELIRTLAEAVHYSHDHGILHRDLKPSNVLILPKMACETVSTLDFRNELPFVPRLTDFGLAKLMEEGASETKQSTVLGTPVYMAPEQARGQIAKIGAATDVYALGAMLYEILTSQPLFPGETALQLLDQVRSMDPRPPRRLRPSIPKDLETICLKCLNKEPIERYQTAAALGADLHRFLNHQPIKARAAGPVYRLRKWVLRRPLPATLIGLSIVALVAIYGFGVHLWGERQREAGWKLQSQEKRSYVGLIRRADRLWRTAELERCRDLFAGPVASTAQVQPRGWEYRYFRNLARSLIFESQIHDQAVYCVAFSPDNRTIASGSDDHVVQLSDVQTGKVRHSFRGHHLPVYSLAFSPDGRILASGGGNGQAAEVKLWDVAKGELIRDLSGAVSTVNAVRFSHDGKTLAVGGTSDGVDKKAEIAYWNVVSGKLQSKVHTDDLAVAAISFSPDGKRFAASYWNGVVAVYDSNGPRLITRVQGHEGIAGYVAFSPDSKTVASSGVDHVVKLWDAETLTERARLSEPVHDMTPLAFLADGKNLVTTSFNPNAAERTATVKIWNAQTGKLRASRGPCRNSRAMAVSPEGKWIGVGCHDGTVCVWDPQQWVENETLSEFLPAVYSLGIDSRGHVLAVAGDDHSVKLWNIQGGEGLATLSGHEDAVLCVAFSKDGKLLATAGDDQTIKLWDMKQFHEITTLTGHKGPIRSLAFSPNGKTLASGSDDETVRHWDLRTGACRVAFQAHQDTISTVAYAPDGLTIATASTDGTVKLWDAFGSKLVREWRDSAMVRCVIFTPDGKQLIRANSDGILTAMELRSEEQQEWLQGHLTGIRAVSISQDGKTVASGGEEGSVKLWQVATGTQLITLKVGPARIYAVAFSPDGEALVAGDRNGNVKLWRATGDPIRFIGNR